MKKLFWGALTLVCASVFVACGEKSASEPSLMGKWVSDTLVKSEDKGFVSAVNTFEFKEDSTVSREMQMVYNIEEKGMKMLLPFEIGYNAKFTVAGNQLVCVGDSASFRFKMEKDSVKITSDDPTTQALADKLITSMVKNIEKEFGGNIKSDAIKPDTVPFFFEGEVLKVVADEDTLVLRRAQ